VAQRLIDMPHSHAIILVVDQRAIDGEQVGVVEIVPVAGRRLIGTDIFLAPVKA